jgi:hypothetical protein
VVETEEEREIYNAYHRELHANKTAAQKADHREYNRQWAENKRRAEGAKPRRLKKLRQPLGHLRPESGEPVFDSAPLVNFLAEITHRHGISSIAIAASLSVERLNSILDYQEKTVTLEIADRILTGVGYPEQLVILYPPEEENND